MKSFSIVMATLNSERTIEKSLSSLRKQNYPRELVDIMVIDGGSKDRTREIAAKYGARVLENPEVIPVMAKLIGMREATGDILMHLDSDEELCSPDALTKRSKAFEENPDVVMLFSEGYKNPEGIPFAARYLNEFGDPFSCFYYRLSKDHRFFLPRMRQLLKTVKETDDYLLMEVGSGPQPILENAACGNCIDVNFFREKFPDLVDKVWGPVHFFYHMQKYTKVFALTKSDAILHYSADHWTGLLRKTRWRIENNLFFVEDLGESGFMGRTKFDPFSAKVKRWLFVPYAFTLVPLLLDTVYLMWSRRDLAYVQHVYFTLYTATMIVGLMAMKLLGFRPQRKSYGEQKVIGGVS